ncbi:NUDIX hydrolase [Catenovulum maritimum]|uniref:DNA mismatch repair protein MutT n=1 Tax=Catenovulum maritimum TaxID=1513271 RepID=A0A0J8GVF6_9ALTE|nr:NUDIX hydrolase [Catenovulum maritimum]KMT65294.1 DNA mismatch repair protein MutT [Catenovulum maritimum]
MRLLRKATHPDVLKLQSSDIKQFTRKATRAIVLKQEKILMLYTKRYDDYTLPGGGIDEGETIVQGFKRELKEETGAQNIKDIQEFGIYEEFRPWYKGEHNVMHMISYCYLCSIDEEFTATQYEDYETRNGMEPVWINLYDAIKHNQETIARSNKKGLSIERETFLLEKIAQELVCQPA